MSIQILYPFFKNWVVFIVELQEFFIYLDTSFCFQIHDLRILIQCLVCGVREAQLHSFARGYAVVSAPFVEKSILSPVELSLLPC